MKKTLLKTLRFNVNKIKRFMQKWFANKNVELLNNFRTLLRKNLKLQRSINKLRII